MSNYQKTAYYLLFALSALFLPFSICYCIGIFILDLSRPYSTIAQAILLVLLICVYLFRYVCSKAAETSFYQEIQQSLTLIERLKPLANIAIVIAVLSMIVSLVRANL